MNVLTPIRPTELHLCRIRLTAGPAAAAEARSHVRAAICAADVPVDRDAAILLTSELVTNAIRHDPGQTVTLAVSYSFGQLRVDVHDTSRSLPAVVEASGDAETGRGLMLVATLSAEWGFYRTSAGKAVYFTLTSGPDVAAAAGAARRGKRRGDCEPLPLPAGLQSPPSPSAIPAAWSPRPEGTQRRFARDVDPRMDIELLQDVGDVGRHGPPGCSSLAAICGLDSPSSTKAAMLVSAGVRLEIPGEASAGSSVAGSGSAWPSSSPVPQNTRQSASRAPTTDARTSADLPTPGSPSMSTQPRPRATSLIRVVSNAISLSRPNSAPAGVTGGMQQTLLP